jgi:hypothetical protein
MLRRCLFLTIFSLAAIPGAALAQVTPAQGVTPPDDTQSIKIGAVLFADWTRTIDPKATDAAGQTYSPNAFNVSRAYINVTGNLSHRVAFRITPDVTREAGAGLTVTGSLVFRIKYAFAQYNLDDWTGDWKQSWARFGIQQTPYVDFMEGIYRYRFQGTIFEEREGTMSSSDAGASFHTNLPGNYGDIHVGVYNGENYNKPDTNNQKGFMIRGTFRPMPGGSLAAKGLRITGFYVGDHYVSDAPRTRAVGNVTYEHKHFNAGFDYLSTTDQTLPTNVKVDAKGWSVWGTPFFKEKGNGPELLLRYDNFQPDTTLDQHRDRTIAGFSYWFPHPGGNATAALLLDYEQVNFKGFPATPANATQKRLAVHGLINF